MVVVKCLNGMCEVAERWEKLMVIHWYIVICSYHNEKLMVVHLYIVIRL